MVTLEVETALSLTELRKAGNWTNDKSRCIQVQVNVIKTTLEKPYTAGWHKSEFHTHTFRNARSKKK